MPTFTPAQHDAIHTHDQNMVVLAGAGSGKTSVLVNRYVELLRTHPDWPISSIVAITFTEKAAREMRARVREAVDNLAESLTLTPAERAEWRIRQSELDSARISTIHSLCATLLRANAAEAALDPGFEVLEEDDAGILREQAVEKALEYALNIDYEVLESLNSEMQSPDFIQKMRDVAKEIQQKHITAPELVIKDDATSMLTANFDQILSDENVIESIRLTSGANDSRLLFATYPMNTIRDTLRKLLPVVASGVNLWGDIRVSWRQRYEDNLSEVLDTLRADENFRAALEWMPTAPPATSDKLAAVWYRLQGVKADFYDADMQKVIAALTMCLDIKLNVGADKSWGGQVKEAKSAMKVIHDIAEATLELAGNWTEADELAARLIPQWIGLLWIAQGGYEELKLERGALDFGDLERLARDLFTDHPEVAARYNGVEFKQLLVDEFQDTNAAQYAIVTALTGLDRPGSLFIVGDAKQSIYGFRGAQVEVFDQVRGEIADNGGVLVPLNRSFRTHGNLIAHFNDLFGDLMGAAYDPLEAERPSEAHHEPSIEIIALDKDKSEGKNAFLADELREWEASELAARLKTIIASGRLVYDRQLRDYRPVEFGDCAILFQAIKDMAFVEAAFKSAGVPYVTFAGRGYYDRQEVADILNLLRALYNQADNLSLASALRSPFFNLSDDALLALRTTEYERLWDAVMSAEIDTLPHPSSFPLRQQRGEDQSLDSPSPFAERGSRGEVNFPDPDAITFARATLPGLAALAGRVTLPELIAAALEATGYSAAILGLPDGARKLNNIEKLIELTRRHVHLSLGDFVSYLRQLSDRESREGEAPVETSGAVQLMTVHAAKGLEFPIVALFNAAHERSNRSEMVRIDPQIGLVCKLPGAEPDSTAIKPFAYQAAERNSAKLDEAERLRLFYVAATRAQDYLILGGTLDAPKLSWLGRVIKHYNLPRDPADAVTVIGDIRYQVPSQRQIAPTPPIAQTGWDRRDSGIVYPALEPPLLAPIPSNLPPFPRMLAASDLEQLGRATLHPERDLPEFGRYLRNNQPFQYGSAADQVGQLPGGRVIGEIVHEVLQWLHSGGDVNQQIRSAAWGRGITEGAILDNLMGEVTELIAATLTTDTWQKITGAQEVYREYPFSYRLGGRIINGQIDVLYRDQFNNWTVVDFKSDQVPRGQAVAEHARRYHMQIGVYAAAVQEAVGTVPSAKLHYIRNAQTLTIGAGVWQSAVDEIEGWLSRALRSTRDDVVQ